MIRKIIFGILIICFSSYFTAGNSLAQDLIDATEWYETQWSGITGHNFFIRFVNPAERYMPQFTNANTWYSLLCNSTTTIDDLRTNAGGTSFWEPATASVVSALLGMYCPANTQGNHVISYYVNSPGSLALTPQGNYLYVVTYRGGRYYYVVVRVQNLGIHALSPNDYLCSVHKVVYPVFTTSDILAMEQWHLGNVGSGHEHYDNNCTCGACCMCNCTCLSWSAEACLTVCRHDCWKCHGTGNHEPGTSSCCECHCAPWEPEHSDDDHGGGDGNKIPDGFELVIENAPPFPYLPAITLPPLNTSIPYSNLPALPRLGDISFDSTVTPFSGKDFPASNTESKAFESHEFGEGAERPERVQLYYFERTGDWTVKLIYEMLLSDLMEAAFSEIPYLFLMQYRDAVCDLYGANSVQPFLPLKFKFDFILFEGTSYAVPFRTPEFDLGSRIEEVRQQPFIPIMRAILLVLLSLYYVLEIFELFFRI